MKRALIALLLTLASCSADRHVFTVAEVEHAIRAGEVDPNLAKRLQPDILPAVRSIVAPEVPVQLFALDDGQFTHVVVADGAKLALLCGAPKGVVPKDFRLQHIDSRWELSFQVPSLEERGHYFLQSPPR